MKTFGWLALLIVGAVVGAPATAADFDATVQWARRVSLGTPVSGIVRSVAVEVGDTVQAGSPMLELEPTPFEADVAELDARVSRTKAVLDDQRKALDRAQELFDREVLSTVELDSARLSFDRAEGEYGEAAAALRGARYRLEHSVIRAPFDGIVVARDAEVGQTVVANLQAPTLLGLAEAGRYRAVAPVPLDAASGLTVGSEATVVIGAQRYPGRIASVGVEPVSGAADARFEVAVDFASAGAVVRPGTAAKITLP
jgi:RND family efflux transporter MFP subunit